MGYCIYYQAIPVKSELYQLLRDDEAAELLYIEVWGSPKPLDLRETAPVDLDEILKYVARTLGLESQEKVDRAFSRLEAAVAKSCDADSGFTSRTVCIKKFHSEVQSRLARVFSQAGIEDHDKLSSHLVFGESSINTARSHNQDGIGLISPESVKRCSEAVAKIDMDSLDPIWASHGTDEYEELIELYYEDFIEFYDECAFRGEAIILHGD